MQITKSTIEKLTITGVERLDSIAVMAENFGEGQGKVTITCFNDCWSYYWGAMGKGTLQRFFITCDNGYLIGKLAQGVEATIRSDDEDDMTTSLRYEIISRRRRDDFGKDDARRLYDDADRPTDGYGNADPDLHYEVFGDEWWYSLPQIKNPKYEYLCRIIDTVKAAFKEELK